jgi:hypothetical protein
VKTLKNAKEFIMKKIAVLLLATIMLMSLISCGADGPIPNNTFISLSNDEILYIGQNGGHFMNYEDKNVTIDKLNYVYAEEYTLWRNYSPSSYYDYVEYEGYYYYWSKQTTNETVELGERTMTTIFSYSYLPYLENEGVDVKVTAKTTVSFDYEGGWIEKDTAVDINLNGYFESFEALKTACPELAKKINTTTTRKYYVDVTIPDNIETEHNFYNTYYYIEKK